MASNWIAVTESQFPWERDALEFVRTQFPTHEPYRAWANFEFIADDGSINDVVDAIEEGQKRPEKVRKQVSGEEYKIHEFKKEQ